MKQFFSWSKFKESKTYVMVLGLAATIWFLVRVIPKPSRATYPCMQAAAPLMSSFVVYLIAVSTSVFAFKKFKESVHASKYLVAGFFMLASILSVSLFVVNSNKEAIANAMETVTDEFPVASNEPIGDPIGLHPGRVVWVHDNGATNEDYDQDSPSGEWWPSDENANQTIITQMFQKGIREYAGKDTDLEAWDDIFKAFNLNMNGVEQGYTAGEKIAIKVNMTNSCCNLEPNRMDVTPQLMNALLGALINDAKVSPSDITIGDPYRNFRSEYRELVIDKYPDVNYVGPKTIGDLVTKTVPTDDMLIQFSDGIGHESSLPQYYADATYFINMPCLKTHDDGGITLIAKNHQGSYLEKGMDAGGQSAYEMHYSLPSQERGAGNYRHTVDYMGHEQMHGKGLIYIVDGIWGGESWQGWIKRFKSDPFNDDFPNSILISQDPVALESVCFDVLFEEYVVDSDKGNHPIKFKEELADLLSQYASSDYWPDGITYDPEGDGTAIGSLGVFEHWNNATDRKYSRNLGTGEGIELKYFNLTPVGVSDNENRGLSLASPNPFVESTTIALPENASNNSLVEIYSMNGQMINVLPFNGAEGVVWHGSGSNGENIPNGMYIYKIKDVNSGLLFSGKVMLSK